MDKYIDTIMSRQPCQKHNAKGGMPCWWVHGSGRGRVLPAICNKRAKRAGFKGIPNPKSLKKS